MSAMAEMTVGKHRVKCRHACILQTMGCCLPWGVSVACFIALERAVWVTIYHVPFVCPEAGVFSSGLEYFLSSI